MYLFGGTPKRLLLKIFGPTLAAQFNSGCLSGMLGNARAGTQF